MDLTRNPGFKDFLLRPEAGDVSYKKEVTWEGRELSYFFVPVISSGAGGANRKLGEVLIFLLHKGRDALGIIVTLDS